VYVSEPLVCVIVSVSMPDEHVWLRLPPLPAVEEENACGEVSVKAPPVELERVIATLVAFTTRLSATEPVAIIRVIADELKEIFAALEYVREATASDWFANPKTAPMLISRKTKKNNNMHGCFFFMSLLLASTRLRRRCRKDAVQNSDVVDACATIAIAHLKTTGQTGCSNADRR